MSQTKTKPIGKADRANFATLLDAVANGDLAAVASVRKSDGKPVTLVCAVSWDGEEYALSPLAVMVEGNPYDDFEAP